MRDVKNLIPVNPEGLDQVAEALLEENPEVINTNSKVENPEKYIILPGRTHGSYSYPDLLVAMDRTEGRSWDEAYEKLHKDNSFMLTLRQYFDFLELLKSGNVYSGEGNRVPNEKIKAILNDILTMEKENPGEPWKGEWLDAYFEESRRNLILYDRIKDDGSLEEVREPLEECLMESCHADLTSINRQGLPTRKGGDIFYWVPEDKKFAFFAVSLDGLALSCSKDREDWGLIRAAKIR